MRVDWTEFVLDQIADIVVGISLDEQDAVERAILRIKDQLERDPWDLGESRASYAKRAWFFEHLVIQFEIFPLDEIVVVQHIAYRKSK